MKYQVTLNTFETKEHFPDHLTIADFYQLLDRHGSYGVVVRENNRSKITDS